MTWVQISWTETSEYSAIIEMPKEKSTASYLIDEAEESEWLDAVADAYGPRWAAACLEKVEHRQILSVDPPSVKRPAQEEDSETTYEEAAFVLGRLLSVATEVRSVLSELKNYRSPKGDEKSRMLEAQMLAALSETELLCRRLRDEEL